MNTLEFKEATIRFGGLTAVAPLSFTLPGGQLAAIIGPNGAGKTTVFNLITGVYAPTGGEIWAAGERIASPGHSLRPHQLTRRGIARTFQNIRLFGELTVEDKYTLRVRRARRLWFLVNDFARRQAGATGKMDSRGNRATAGDFWFEPTPRASRPQSALR